MCEHSQNIALASIVQIMISMFEYFIRGKHCGTLDNLVFLSTNFYSEAIDVKRVQISRSNLGSKSSE